MGKIKHALGPYVRSYQTFFPFLQPVKYGFFNALTRYLGTKADAEIKVLSKFGPLNTVVDVGGNWGQTIEAYRRFSHPARIVAFEPIPFLANRLRRTYSKVEVHGCALADESGDLKIHVPRYRQTKLEGLAALDRGDILDWMQNPKFFHPFDLRKLTILAYRVNAATLDSFNLAPDVVNIDVQGAESIVVAGGAETFRTHQPITIVEAPPPALIAQFAEWGMEPYGTDGHDVWPNPGERQNVMFIAQKWLDRLA